jgi:hypothetical protein
MKRSRTAGIVTTLLIIAVIVIPNVWASQQANKITPIEVAALATVGTVNSNAHNRFNHLKSARDGFYLLRVWHWWRYNALAAD